MTRGARRVWLGLAVMIAALAPAAAAPPDAGVPDGGAPDGGLDDELAALADAPPTFDPTQARALGFDHRIHDRNLVVSGKEALACTRCHVLAQGRIVGRPGHDACFGACHGAAPRAARALRVPPAQVQVCTACHAGAALAARVADRPAPLTVPYPPYAIDRDFGLVLSHRGHAATACETCHPAIAAPATAKAPRSPHARCAGCHPATLNAATRRAAPPMSGCATCHPEAYGPASSPSLIEGPLALTGFDHASHRARAAATCASCHAAIAASDGIGLAAPTSATCATATCHDGTAAFALTTACTRCHTRAPTATYRAPRPATRYSHAAHAARLGDAACASCHALDRHGEATAPGHDACVRCHADDFGAAAPRTCGACHVATEPWRHLIADRAPPPETEFGARLSHAAHVAPCSGCHQLASGARELRPPRGHAACAGACHQRATGPAPHLDDCAGCHVLGLVADRARARLTAPWSVRARFAHAPHAAADCTACHGGVTAATGIADVPTPRKAACAPCHDGQAAFKLTGTDCARCHGGAP